MWLERPPNVPPTPPRSLRTWKVGTELSVPGGTESEMGDGRGGAQAPDPLLLLAQPGSSKALGGERRLPQGNCSPGTP